MSLNFNVAKIKNHRFLTTHPDDHKKLNKDGSFKKGVSTLRWAPITDSLVWLSLGCGFNEITEANWKQVFTRISIHEATFGTMKRRVGKDGHLEDWPITPKDVFDHIGLTTNASKLTDAQFNKLVIQRLTEDATYAISEFENPTE